MNFYNTICDFLRVNELERSLAIHNNGITGTIEAINKWVNDGIVGISEKAEIALIATGHAKLISGMIIAAMIGASVGLIYFQAKKVMERKI